MGYRSDVSFAIRLTKDPEEFVALMKVDGRDIFKDFLRFMWVKENDLVVDENSEKGTIFFHHDHWKWYDDSRDGFTELLQMAEDFDENFMAKIVRLGEESDDVEEEWFNDDHYEMEFPCLIREVDVGWKKEIMKKVEE